MKFIKTAIEDVYIIEPEPKADTRGNFSRIFCANELQKQKLSFDIVQINRSFTRQKGTIRGLHFQKEPKSEGKIIQCLKGAIYDVVVDLRHDSKTYGKWIAYELSEENNRLFFIPKGFAHGYQTLTNNCDVLYFMSEYYISQYSAGLRWDDPSLAILWPLKHPQLSEKDKQLPFFTS